MTAVKVLWHRPLAGDLWHRPLAGAFRPILSALAVAVWYLTAAPIPSAGQSPPPNNPSESAAAAEQLAATTQLGAGESPAPQRAAGESPAPQEGERGSPAPQLDFGFNESVSPQQAERIAEWTRELAHPKFEVRRQAEQRLRLAGAAALPRLRDVYRATNDLEVRLRIEAIVYESFMDHHLTAQNGFMGILIGEIVTDDSEGPLPEGGVAVRVTRVVAGLSADRAGMMDGDLIIRLDGEPIQAGFDWFRDAIRARKRGEVLKVDVLRKGREYPFEVVLDGRPVEEFNQDLAPMRIAAERKFQAWWTRHFIDAAGPGEGEGESEKPK